jgi:hypothetical protein
MSPADSLVAEPQLARLPEIAWTGLVKRYRDLVAPCTEAPEAFHLGCLIAAVGCLIGRRAWVVTPHATYPNFYSLLVGSTANTRKSTAYQFALGLREDASYVLGAKTKRMNGLASVEGLAAAMRDPKANEPFRVVCVEDEFKSLITKSGQRAVGNIIPKVTELYNCPPSFEVNTKNDPIKVQSPFLCMLAATTRAWFEDSLSANDVSGGFLNRWLLFEGEPGALLPFPPPLDTRGWDDLVLDVCAAVHQAAGHYDFSPEAKEVYRSFYRAARRNYCSEATARIDLHAKKLGLLYAVLAGHSQIRADDIQSAIAVAEYCAQVVEPLAARLDVSPQKRLEDRLLDLLKGGRIGRREAYRTLHVAARDLYAASRSLQEMGQIKFEGDKYCLVGE